jgi:competence protein ComEC
VKRVVVNGDGTKDTVAWADLAVALDDAHSRGDVVVDPGLAAGQIAVDGLREFSIEVVAPSRRLVLLGVGNADPELGRITSNTLSACIRIMVGERPVALLAGDLDEVGLADIARAARPIEAEVLVFPHHGGSPGGRHVGSFVQRLLDLVRPTSVVFSNGRARFNNPRPEIVDAVLRHSPSVYIACSQLSEECSPTVASERAHLPPCYSAGGAAGFSCAGTVVCTAGPSGASIPSAPRHVDFVEQHVASPMCRRRSS